MFETLASRELYRDSSFRVTVDDYQLPEAKTGTLLQIHHPGGVAVLGTAMRSNRSCGKFRQASWTKCPEKLPRLELSGS